MVELRINDNKLDVNFLMHYRLVHIERQFFFTNFTRLEVSFLEAISTPSHLINPPILSPDKYAGKEKQFFF